MEYKSIVRTFLVMSLIVTTFIGSVQSVHAAEADQVTGSVISLQDATQSLIDTLKQLVDNNPNGDQILSLTAQPQNTEAVAQVYNYFARHNSPAMHYAEDFVLVAEKYNLESPYTMAMFAQKESSGGRYGCFDETNNFFGFGAVGTQPCITGRHFDTPADAIDYVARNIAGLDEGTAHYYRGKSFEKVVTTYNSINPKYYSELMSIKRKMMSMSTEVQLTDDKLAFVK